MKKAFNYGLYLLIFAVLGFSREFLFVNMNNQLYKLYYGNSKVPLPASIRFIEVFDYTTLYYLKYPLTLAYFIAYFLSSYFAVKTVCGDKKFSKWIIYIYALLLILSCISMAYNYIINNQLNGNEYTFSRWLMGIAQSPLVAFFVIASGTLYQKFKTDH
jgi:hypothetical protein